MHIIIKIVLIAAILISLSAGCNDTPTKAFGYINSPQGSNITLEYSDGSKENISGTTIFGWERGAFLERNYWRQLRMGTDKGTLAFRLNFPKDVRPEGPVVEKKHELRMNRLLLRNSQVIEEVSAELFFQSSDEFDGFQNATGTVEIQQNISNDGEDYDVTAEIDAKIINEQGEPVKITGYFWKQNAN